MEKQDFLSLIKEGKYEIKSESECGCGFSWAIQNGELTPNVDGDMCWFGRVLYMLDSKTGLRVPIIQNIAFESLEAVDVKDITDLELREVIEGYHLDMFFDENTETNDDHERRELNSLVEWLEESEYDFYIDPRRGFANEYDCVLAQKGSAVDGMESVAAQDWAERYLEKGDAATKYFVGFNLID